MRIDTIIELLDGELRNRGFISEIIGFADKLNQVTREFLFISNDENEIKEAIQNGAYAILSSENVKIIDNEIAWIRVENIEESLLKLLKLGIMPPPIMMRKELTAFYLTKLFPNRFENLQQLYYDLIPNDGIIEEVTEEDLYIKLIQLYQTTSMN